MAEFREGFELCRRVANELTEYGIEDGYEKCLEWLVFGIGILDYEIDKELERLRGRLLKKLEPMG